MPTSTVEHHRWSDVAAEAINPFITRRYPMGERITVAQLELKRGGVVAMHAQAERGLIPGDRTIEIGDGQMHRAERQRGGQLADALGSGADGDGGKRVGGAHGVLAVSRRERKTGNRR